MAATTEGSAKATEARSPRRFPRGWGVALAALAVVGGAVLLLAATGRFAPPLPGRAGAPAYREVTYTFAQPLFGRDLVIAPGDATPETIEAVVATVAATDSSPLLRLNVFTNEAAARRRRDLIVGGVYATSEDEREPDPPEWAEVYPAWIGIYTRDPANGVHQLSICLDDPSHSHCTVRRY